MAPSFQAFSNVTLGCAHRAAAKRSAYEAGGKALEQQIKRYREEHQGRLPQKFAFSLWSSEAMRHLGILGSHVPHRSLEIIPSPEHPSVSL